MTEPIKTTPTAAAVTRSGDTGVMSLFQNPAMKDELQKALPKNLSADRILRIALTEVRKNPKLLECTKESVAGSLIQSAQLGLEPGNNLGHAYLQPVWNGKTKRLECQFILGYKGMLELVRRTGKINRIRTAAVHEKDVFECEYGTHEKLRHVPTQSDDKGEIALFYCTAHIAATGECLFEIMTKSQIDAVRDEVFRKNKYVGGTWVDYYEEMAKKTVLRRAFKYLPMSIELAQAITLDELAEAGIQDNSALIDASAINHDKAGAETLEEEPLDEAKSLKLDIHFDPKTGEILDDDFVDLTV